MTLKIAGKSDDALDDSAWSCMEMLCGPDWEIPEKLRNLEPRFIEHVSMRLRTRIQMFYGMILLAGLDHAKKCVTEMVIWPLLRLDIFKGNRQNNDWESHRWRGKSNIFLHVCQFINKQINGKSAFIVLHLLKLSVCTLYSKYVSQKVNMQK